MTPTRQQEWLRPHLAGLEDRNRERAAERARRQRLYGPVRPPDAESLKRGDRVRLTQEAAKVLIIAAGTPGTVLRTWLHEDGQPMALVRRDGACAAETWSSNCWEHTSAGSNKQQGRPDDPRRGAGARRKGMNELAKELSALLNKHSQENASDTPDFLLANFMLGCLAVYNDTVCAREVWYGRDKSGGPATVKL